MGEKKRIEISVNNKIACLVNPDDYLVCGNNDYEVVFSFDGDWEGINAKTAVFVYGNTPVHEPFTGNVCKGVEIKNATLCAIGVFAGNIKTTTGATIECKASIRDWGGVPKPPKKEVYDEIMALLDKAIEAHTELPVGGEAGQVLKKKSNEDYDTHWADEEKEDLSIFVKHEEFQNSNKAINDKIGDLDFRVSTLENLTLKYITDDTTKYKKAIPIGVGNYAILENIGGMTYAVDGELRDSAVTSLKIHGANILGGEALKDEIKSGIPNAVLDETNKTISFTAREASSFKFTDIKPNIQYTVILYGKNTTAGTKITNIIFRYADGTYTSLGFTTADVMSYAVGQNDTSKNLVEISGTYGSGTTILEYEKCGIFEGNIPLEQFRPYTEPKNIPIPEAIQALPNYGKMFTHLDLVNNTYTDASYSVHFKTDDTSDPLDNHLKMVDEFEYLAYTEGWKEGDIAAKAKLRYYVNPVDSLPELGVLIAKGNYTNVTYDGYYLIFDAYTYSENVDEYVYGWYGTITEIEAVFRTDADCLITVADVSEHLPPKFELIKIEGGGEMEFVNEYKNPVPSEIVYVAKKE